MGHKVSQIDAKPLRDLIKLHGLSITDIAMRTGLSTSALYTWDRTGRMPEYMRAVCQGIVSQIKRDESRDVGETETLIVRVPPGQKAALEKVMEALGAKYRLVDDI